MAKGPDVNRRREINVRRARKGDTSISPESDAASMPVAQTPSDVKPNLVGRQHEMRAVASGIDEALRGTGSTVLFFGEPGIGKTRLAEEAAGLAERSGAKVLWGRCWEGYGVPAFWPWVQVARACEDGMETALPPGSCSGSAIEMGGITQESGWPMRFASAANTASDPHTDQARFHIFDTFAGFLKKAATRQPLVIVLDDLHWGDAPSLILLEFIISEIRQSRIMIVGTFRDVDHGQEHPMPSRLGALVRHRHCCSLPLARFSEQESAQFLGDYAGSSPSSAWATALHEKSDGNPLFISELAALLVSTRRLEEPGKAGSCEIAIPRTLRQVIMHRLSHLHPETMKVLAVGAVIGREFELGVLVSVDGMTSTAALLALDEAGAAGIVAESPTSRGHYRFSHGLIRDSLYEELQGSRRVDTHYQIAKVLEEQFVAMDESRLSQIAYHYCQSMPTAGWQKAVDYCLLAGARAALAVAYEDAVLHYERALRALAGGASNLSRRCEILLGLGDVQAKAGDWCAARRTFSAAVRVARGIGEAETFAKAAIGFKGVLASTDPIDTESVALLEEAVGLLKGEDSIVLVKVLAALALSMYYARPACERARLGERAVGLAEAIGDAPTLCAALEARYFGQWRPGGVRDGLVTLDSMVQLARSAGEKDILFRASIFRYMTLIELGRVSDSEREWVGCVELAEEIRHPRYMWQIAVIAGGRALLRGDLGGAVVLWKKARVLGGQVHDATAQHYFLLQRFCGLRLMGAVEELYDVFLRIRAQVVDIPAYQGALGSICCRSGRVEEAREILDSFERGGFERLLDNGFGLFCVSMISEMVSHLGDRGKAEELYRLLLPYADHNVVVSWGAACDGSASHYLGVLAGTLSRWQDASRHFEDAVVMNRKLGAAPFVARSQHYYAEAVWKRNERGDRARAQQAVSRAIETYRRLEMKGYLRQALALLSSWKSGCSGPSAVYVPEDEAAVSTVGDLTDNVDMSAVLGDEKKRTSEANVLDHQLMMREKGLGNQYVFRREGEYWTINFRGVVSRLRSTVGLEYLAYLVSRPHQEIPAIDLASAVGRRGTAACPTHGGDVRLIDDQLRVAGLGDAGPIFDRRARDAYRGRMKDLRIQVEEAEEMNDVGRASALRREIEAIREELAAGCGLGGRLRVAAAAFERARINVRNSISSALRAIDKYDRALWRHLTNSIRTGALCCYDPEDEVPWVVSM